MSTQDLVNKLWSFCHVLRDDGVTFHEYINELTFLIFLKMVEETGQNELIPEGYRWRDLENHNDAQRLDKYKELLLYLGKHGSLITQSIYRNANTVIRKPATLTKLVNDIDKLDWYSAKAEGLGDMYEGLLEINATEKKSGAGQYFTPRALINTMVALTKPQLDDVIVDPTAGTGGFLISAHHYINEHNDIHSLDETAYEKYQHQTFYGMELVPDTRRLAMMNLMLHNLAINDTTSGILYGDTLSNDGKILPQASLVLANPPFGTKQGGGVPTRDDLIYTTSNKQLAFLHLIYHRLLKPGARAAIVLPDNVLFEDNVGKTIRQDLMHKCHLHTILRLPTGIFYAQGVKTNVLFFSKPLDQRQDQDNTHNVWVYDLRTNMPQFGKRNPFSETHMRDFCQAVGNDLTRVDEKARLAFIENYQATEDEPQCRFKCFSREEIKAKDDSLDLTWLKDKNAQAHENLSDPDVLINEAMFELTQAMDAFKETLTILKDNDDNNHSIEQAEKV